MKLKITVIRFEVVDGKKKAKSFTFEKDPKEYAHFKTAATVQRRIEEYIAKSGIFKRDEMKDLNYNFDKKNSLKNFLKEWRKEVCLLEEEELKQLSQSPNNPESRITPANVTRLANNEVFVFGSNEEGRHYDGAARTAFERFGAVMGEGTGLHGKSYAIPSMSGYGVLSEYVNEFSEFAKAHPEQHFLVTEIGCGIAGYKPSDVARLFETCRDLQNVSLPSSFWAIIQ